MATIDLALALHVLVPEAKYGGSVTSNNKEAFDAIRWEDMRDKPKWEDVEVLLGSPWQEPSPPTMEEMLEALIADKQGDTSKLEEVLSKREAHKAALIKE
jgi:hypothetical protein